MIVPSKPCTIEIEVKKSRFIATAFFCDSFDTLKTVISKTRADNPGCNHVVHAAVIGGQFSLSDDHEPKSTAGRPALEVLKGSKINNIGLTIVRYFGGTLLGTGGLVKAYSDSAKAALANLETEEFITRIQLKTTVGYEMHKSVMRFLDENEATAIKEEFADVVTITAEVPEALRSSIDNGFSNLTNGRINLQWC